MVKIIFVFFIFLLLFLYVNDDKLYWVDFRFFDEIKQLGGFMLRGQSEYFD